MSIRRKKDIVASLKGILAVIATIASFIVILMIVVILERLILG